MSVTPREDRGRAGPFRSLANSNFRLYAAGALVSNIGTWMQRTAQDWLVLTELTDKNATAMGIVVALQFAPQVLLLPWTGLAADRLDRRKLLLAMQVAMAILALGLGLLTITGRVVLWHVYVFALLLGCVAAFDAPARQTFLAELVGEDELPNAVALNSISFNLGRTIGPAAAGLLIAAAGTGWSFLCNAASFAILFGALALLRPAHLVPAERAAPGPGRLAESAGYVLARPLLRTLLVMTLLIFTLGLNFPIFVATMSVGVFDIGSDGYGILATILAAGAICGALIVARRTDSQLGFIVLSAALFGLGCAAAALVPGGKTVGLALFAVVLFLVGMTGQMFATASNSLLQLATAPEMRGRVVAILLAAALGGTPIGAPFVGWIADRFGPRWGLVVGAVAGLAAALVGLRQVEREKATKA